jgi:ElaB/YqjD/DUF883 family membrane-anchored ribosome-binding protein
MGEKPDRIRSEIAETREQLSGQPASERFQEEFEESKAEMDETMDALGRKADVKGRIKGSVTDAKDAVTDRARSVVSTVTDVAPDTQDVKQGARKVGLSKDNPLGLAIGGAAVGFLAGLLIPKTRVEDEKLGPVSDDLKERATEVGSEALERGKHIAEETLESAKQAASDAASRTSDDTVSDDTLPSLRTGSERSMPGAIG